MSNELALVREETGEIVGVVGSLIPHESIDGLMLACDGIVKPGNVVNDTAAGYRHTITPLADDSPLREIVRVGKALMSLVPDDKEINPTCAMDIGNASTGYIRVWLRPIPPADTMESLLRECVDFMDEALRCSSPDWQEKIFPIKKRVLAHLQEQSGDGIRVNAKPIVHPDVSIKEQSDEA